MSMSLLLMSVRVSNFQAEMVQQFSGGGRGGESVRRGDARIPGLQHLKSKAERENPFLQRGSKKSFRRCRSMAAPTTVGDDDDYVTDGRSRNTFTSHSLRSFRRGKTRYLNLHFWHFIDSCVRALIDKQFRTQNSCKKFFANYFCEKCFWLKNNRARTRKWPFHFRNRVTVEVVRQAEEDLHVPGPHHNIHNNNSCNNHNSNNKTNRTHNHNLNGIMNIRWRDSCTAMDRSTWRASASPPGWRSTHSTRPGGCSRTWLKTPEPKTEEGDRGRVQLVTRQPESQPRWETQAMFSSPQDQT